MGWKIKVLGVNVLNPRKFAKKKQADRQTYSSQMTQSHIEFSNEMLQKCKTCMGQCTQCKNYVSLEITTTDRQTGNQTNIC